MAKKNVEAIVPLLPMQRGFLWRSLANNSDACELTLHCTLRGQIDLSMLEQAWQLVVNSHQALRSSVHWHELSVPVQVVHKDVKASVILNELVSVSTEDKDTGHLDLTKVPAHQMTLTAVSTDTCDVDWLISHVLLDGWSCSLVINDWLRHYSGLLNGQAVSAMPSMALNRYSQWARKQDEVSVNEFWNNAITPQTPLATPLPYLDQIQQSLTDTRHAAIKQTIDTDTTEKLLAACKSAGISINSILQAAFGLVLKPINSNDNLVFSSTVSGRQVDVPHIDTYVGMLINVMPVSVTFNQILCVREWLLEHQETFFSSLPYAHLDLANFIDSRGDMQTNAETRLADPVNCLLVVENQATATSTKDVTVSDYRSGIVSEMDLTLLVIPGNNLIMEVRYRNDLLGESAVNNLLTRLSNLLASLPTLLDQPLSATVVFQTPDAVASSSEAALPQCSTPNDIHANGQQSYAHLQPKPMVEQKLQILWQQVFGNSIDSDTAFFDLGGNSLQAVRLFALIEKHMGCVLPATTLFTAPTINKLATFILNNHNVGLEQNVVGINTDGTQTPLFVPFEQSDMLLYRHLFDALGVDQPIYGLQTSQTPIHDASEIDTLIQTMTTLHPTGPYMLAGLSGSGISAWTIAAKLEALGHEVAMLGLLDTYGPEYPILPPPWTMLARVTRQLLREGVAFSKAQLKKRLLKDNVQDITSPKLQASQTTQINDQSVFSIRMADDRRRAVDFAKKVTQSRPLSERLAVIAAVRIASFNVRSFGLKMELLLLIQGLLLQHCQRSGMSALDKLSAPLSGENDEGTAALRVFLERYESMYGGLEPYKGKLVYLAATQRQAVCLDDHTFGWSNLLPDHTETHNTPGAHLNMLNPPNVSTMAKILSREMALAIEAI